VKEKSTGRKILDLVITVIVLLVGMGAYGSGGTMAFRIIGLPIPAWIFFPVMLLVLFGEIKGLVPKRHPIAGEKGSGVE
jgi:hypothetical protein